ncbi:hypothetical protein EMCRGX_G017508 [Ephydatia muelleri]
MALFVLSPFLAPAEIEVWLALSKVLKFAYCDRVNPESMGYYETIVQNFVATAVVHGIFLLYGGSPKSTCFFIFLNICECLVRHLVITPKDAGIFTVTGKPLAKLLLIALRFGRASGLHLQEVAIPLLKGVEMIS